MRFKTKAHSEQQLRAMRIWPNGDYEFKVVDVLDFDKNGNQLMGGKNKAYPKTSLVLRVWDNNDKSRLIYDDLIDCEEFSWKIRHIFHAVDLGHVYDNDEHDSQMLLDKSGWLTLGTQPKSGKYDEKNIVRDYNVPDKSITSKTDNFQDDEIPVF